MICIASIIDTYATSTKANSYAYNDLVMAAVEISHGDRWTWEKVCRIGEDKFMEEEFWNVPAAKKKDGSWKYRTYLDGSYTSAKSIIGTALEMGIALTDEADQPKGKTALQNEIKEAKGAGSESEKTSVEKVQIMLASIRAVYDKELDHGLRAEMRSLIVGLAAEVCA